jgi:hypothetical protein
MGGQKGVLGLKVKEDPLLRGAAVQKRPPFPEPDTGPGGTEVFHGKKKMQGKASGLLRFHPVKGQGNPRGLGGNRRLGRFPGSAGQTEKEAQEKGNAKGHRFEIAHTLIVSSCFVRTFTGRVTAL